MHAAKQRIISFKNFQVTDTKNGHEEQKATQLVVNFQPVASRNLVAVASSGTNRTKYTRNMSRTVIRLVGKPFNNNLTTIKPRRNALTNYSSIYSNQQWCRHSSNTSSSNDTTADFGFKEVKSSQKQDMVKEVFSKVAQKYDIMNDLMSVGDHRLWKDDFVGMMGLGAAARIQSDKVPRFLDVAGGTGDIAFRIVDNLFAVYGHTTVINSSSSSSSGALPDQDRQVVVCDINPDMLAVGRQRAPIQLSSNRSDVVGFVEGNAEHLPFPDESFDVYTIAFGLRNVTNKEVSFILTLFPHSQP